MNFFVHFLWNLIKMLLLMAIATGIAFGLGYLITYHPHIGVGLLLAIFVVVPVMFITALERR